jgi:AcrR family transcriptional regulator
VPDDLRDRLVAAGVDLVAERGGEALSLREIARRAGVSHGAPRRHFPTHRELLAAVARVGYEELTERVALLPRDADLLAVGRLYLSFAQERRGMFELMFRHELLRGNNEQLRAASKPLFGVLVDRLGSVAAAGALWANLHGIAQLWLWGSLQMTTGSDDAEELLRTAVAAYTREST